MGIKEAVQKLMSQRLLNVGETIEFGWFIFRIAAAGQPPRIEALNFRDMAVFTDDFSEVERIHSLQLAALAEFSVRECHCNLGQSAVISRSYFSGRDDVFLERQQTACDGDSGWYVGVFDDPLDMEDEASFTRSSLYELTIKDMRMAPYWLLPSGVVVPLSSREMAFR